MLRKPAFAETLCLRQKMVVLVKKRNAFFPSFQLLDASQTGTSSGPPAKFFSKKTGFFEGITLPQKKPVFPQTG